MPSLNIGQLPQPPSNRCYAASTGQTVQSHPFTQQNVPHLTAVKRVYTFTLYCGTF